MTPRRIVITGATGGLGRALVRAYAGTAADFLLFGRDDARLEAARIDAEAAGARAVAVAMNVTDTNAMDAAIVLLPTPPLPDPTAITLLAVRPICPNCIGGR